MMRSLFGSKGKSGMMAMLIFLQCGIHEPSDREIVAALSGMTVVPSKGKTVQLGSAAAGALIDEKPVTPVTFTYDFQMDTTEITVQTYRSIMNRLPREYDTIADIDDITPVRYVTWYDAVLFCNVRSIREGRDTVYTFSAVEHATGGAVIQLRGLKCNFTADGYRLPAEAEWNFAARGTSDREFVWGTESSVDSAARYCWYNGNAQGKLQPVASLKPNMFGLYDMEGNAAEWVYETKIPLGGILLTDFVGGAGFAATLKMIKGGSSCHDIGNLRISRRTDQYPVDAASRNTYTGIRCVIGVIYRPSYLVNGGAQVNIEEVSVSDLPVIGLLGTDARMAFVNRSGSDVRTLCYIDYTTNPPLSYQFTDRVDVYSPVISPDGNWVAWATVEEGLSGNSRVSIRRLVQDDTLIVTLPDTPAFVPRWYVDVHSGDTFVLYVNSAGLNDQYEWTLSQTKMIRFVNGQFTDAPVTIESQGAFHGGRSADGVFIATGYPRLKVKNLSTRSVATLFYAPFDGKKGSDTSQVCNVSISPDTGEPQVLFLDFGSGRDISTLTHSVYRSHEYLFRASVTGAVERCYRIPPPYDSWNHAEWSNRKNIAVSAVVSANGLQEAIYCVNLANGETLLLCNGTDLQHPYLWVSPSGKVLVTELDIDSAGQYDAPHMSIEQALLSYKMRLFWHFSDSLEVLFVGSSVAADGIDPREFSGFKGLNMAVGGGDFATSIEIIKNYALPHCPRLKAIGMSYDMFQYFLPRGEFLSYQPFTQGKGYRYDRDHDFWRGGVSDAFRTLVNYTPVSKSLGVGIEALDSLGLIIFPCMGFGGEPPPVNGNTKVTLPNENYRKNVDLLAETIRLCSERGIKLVLVNFPVDPGYKTTVAYGPLNPSWATAQSILTDIGKIDEDEQYLTFYDANIDGKHDYTSEEFFDAGHLCQLGARKLSARVDSVFREVLKE